MAGTGLYGNVPHPRQAPRKRNQRRLHRRIRKPRHLIKPPRTVLGKMQSDIHHRSRAPTGAHRISDMDPVSAIVAVGNETRPHGPLRALR